jgi:hypothetical protein
MADLLTATLAAAHKLTVIHYDTDFETAATLLDFQHQWVVPRGSLEASSWRSILRGFTVSEQVRCHHPILLRKLGEDRPPGGRTARHPMDQQQRLTVSRLPIGNTIAVQLEIVHLAHVHAHAAQGSAPLWRPTWFTVADFARRP